MKLSALLASDTAGRIRSAEQAIATAGANIAKLAAERQSALAADDAAIDAVRKIDAKIADERGAIVALEERLGILRARHVEASRQAFAREHRAAVERFAGTLSPIERAASKIEAAIAVLSAAARDYEVACDAARVAWPAGLVAWGAYHLDGGRMGGLIESCFSPGGLCRRYGDQIIAGPAAEEFAARAISADERSAGFAEQEREHHVELMNDLRAQPVPYPEPEPEPLDDELAA